MAPSKKQLTSESKLTEKAIERQVGERSFRLGRDYCESSAIFDGRREGDCLKARCQGRSADYYVLSVQVKGGRIAAAQCSCPVGAGGHCKHMAALLLTWLQAPEEFRATEPLAKQLNECSKSRLIELMQQMIEQEPNLESWLELALPAAVPSDNVVKPDAYRRQTVAAFASAGYGWEADHELTAALEALKKIGDQFRSQKNAASAAAVYGGILDGFISEYETFQDETGNVTAVAAGCIQAVGKCLPKLAAGSKPREAALLALFQTLRFDINFGGMGLSDEVPDILLKQATAAERTTIAGWIRKEVSSGKPSPGDSDFVRKWRREAWGGLLLDLEGEPADDEAYLRHCREFGLAGALLERLLERGRLEEALQEIRSSTDFDLMRHADRLVAHKHVDLAHALVRERLASNPKNNNQWQLREWLERFHEAQKDWTALFQLRVENFRERPSLGGYQAVRECAKKLKTWEALRPELMSSVPKNSPELIRIHLDEGDVGQAIALLESRPKNRLGGEFGWDRIDLDVAKAAEKSHPEAALKTYRAEAERLIAGRGRGNYQAACDYLKKVKRLSNAVGRMNDWNAYLAMLREQHRSLRALQEELAQARL